MAKTDKTEYSIGEDVKVSIYLVNNLDREVISRSKSYGLSVTGSKGVVLFCVSSETRVSPITVPPYTTYLIGEWVWNQRNADRNQVDVGTYVIRVNLLDAEARAEYGVDCVIEIK